MVAKSTRCSRFSCWPSICSIFATDAGDFLLDFEDVADFAGALRKDGLEALFGFAGIFQARDEIGVLLRDFFAVLRFEFNAAEGF
jgi:hypothetical protein